MIYLFFVLGTVFGSFFNVVIYRLPHNISVVTPRSSCSSCGHYLSGIDMIPVLSYLIFRGKCRHCDQSYSIRYLLVECLTGIIYVIAFKTFGVSFDLLYAILIASLLIIVSFIDIDHQIIYDRFPIIIAVVSIFYHMTIGDLRIFDMFLGFLIGGGFLFLIAIVGTMGGGDIKLMASLGLLLGPIYIGLSLYLSFVIGATILLPIVFYNRKKSGKVESVVAFGPFLCIGSLIAYFYGADIIQIYFNMFI